MICRRMTVLFFALFMPLQLLAQGPNLDSAPHQVVDKISRNVLDTLESSRALFDTDPQAFYAAIDKAVAPGFDFERMAYLVMDQKYYSRSSADQRQRFVAVFRKSLIETYARGMIGVTDTSYKISPPSPDDAGKSSINVEQTLTGGGDTVKAVYSMRQGSDSQWLINNVIIEGINLGRTFRNQFAQLANRYNDDIDKVIENWSPEQVGG
jgi:phospholipid transport system substrate-binding protein